MNYHQPLVAAVLGSLLQLAVQARPVPGLSLGDLSDAADLIAAGEITSIQAGEWGVIEGNGIKVPIRWMIAEVRIDRVLKGTASTPRLPVKFVQPYLNSGYAAPRPGRYSVFFLESSGQGFRFASPFYPSVIAMTGVQPQGETPLEQVIQLVSAVLRSPGASREARLEAIEALTSSGEAAATDALRSVVGEMDQPARLRALAALMLQGDMSNLEVAVNAILQPAQDASPELIRGLAGGIGAGIADPRAIPVLERLQNSEDPFVRRCAAQALMFTRSVAAQAGLIRALDDADQMVRYFAVRGLAAITRQSDWQLDQATFRSQEEKYLTYWRDWAKKR